MYQVENSKAAKPLALFLCASFVMPPLLAGCGGGGAPQETAPPPPTMTRTQPKMQPKQGMSTKQKLVLLAGAAALYYLYRRHQAAKAQQGPEGKYFISKSTGRVYYRNLKDGSFQWVSPPAQPVQVSPDEAQEYSGYAGYNNQNTGRGFGGYGPGMNSNYSDTVPATTVVQ